MERIKGKTLSACQKISFPLEQRSLRSPLPAVPVLPALPFPSLTTQKKFVASYAKKKAKKTAAIARVNFFCCYCCPKDMAIFFWGRVRTGKGQGRVLRRGDKLLSKQQRQLK